jgi:hypothetical protein
MNESNNARLPVAIPGFLPIFILSKFVALDNLFPWWDLLVYTMMSAHTRSVLAVYPMLTASSSRRHFQHWGNIAELLLT